MKLRDREQFFTQKLMDWHNKHNLRSMPWKGESDPYKIWLSEIILQQTRVEQGWNYYLRFIKAYPTVKLLAAAPDEAVFKLWEGLGYYNRCRNLLHTARVVSDTYDGRFPADYQALLALKGIGPYTAAAISSFAFGLPKAVTDGNVARVLARFFLREEPVDAPMGMKIFSSLAQNLLDEGNPGGFNQAIMDFGATVCKPLSPLCMQCPLQTHCLANKNGMVNILPNKTKKPARKHRFFCYFIFQYGKKVWVTRRKQQDIWQDLHEFWLQEMDSKAQLQHADLGELLSLLNISGIKAQPLGGIYQQTLTHQQINTRFYGVKLNNKPDLLKGGMWLSTIELKQLAFPKTITNFLLENILF